MRKVTSNSLAGFGQRLADNHAALRIVLLALRDPHFRLVLWLNELISYDEAPTADLQSRGGTSSSYQASLDLIVLHFGSSHHAKPLELRGCDGMRHQPQPSQHLVSKLFLYRTHRDGYGTAQQHGFPSFCQSPRFLHAACVSFQPRDQHSQI